ACAESLALKVLRMIDANTSCCAGDNPRIREGSIVEDGQHAVGQAARAREEKLGEGEFGQIMPGKFQLIVKDARNHSGHALVLEGNSIRLHLAGNQRHDPVVWRTCERKCQIAHLPKPPQRLAFNYEVQSAGGIVALAADWNQSPPSLSLRARGDIGRPPPSA